MKQAHRERSDSTAGKQGEENEVTAEKRPL